MSIRWARRTERMRASEIRELLKLTERPSVISFGGGLPAPELFPVRELIGIGAEVLVREGNQALQYSTTEGHPPLREWIAERMATRFGIGVSADEILITCGSQQGLDLSGMLLLDPDDVVLCESPTYLGAIQAFRSYEPRFVEVETDDDGMLPESLERCLSTETRAKLIYVVPDFQNPTGRCWSLARRQACLDLAQRFDLPIIEDQPYAELRFEGKPIPPIKALDREGAVVMLGTFSKIFCPGLRLGWVAAPAALRDRYVLAKQGADLHTSSLSQRQLTAYLLHYDIDANIQRIREVYRKRRLAMIAALDREMPEGVRFTRPQGGLFMWLELPLEVNARDLLVASLKRDVAFVPGGAFFPNGGHENTCRLNYSAMPEDRIDEGVRRLAAALRELLGQSVSGNDRPANGESASIEASAA